MFYPLPEFGSGSNSLQLKYLQSQAGSLRYTDP